MRCVFVLLITLISFAGFSQKNSLRKGSWEVKLLISESTPLPFTIEVKKNRITVLNGEEEIVLNDPILKNDSLHYRFPFFNSQLIIKAISKEEFSGFWFNYNKGEGYKIPVHGEFTHKKKKKEEEVYANFDGKWEVKFAEETNHAYPAIGQFTQKENRSTITGTFLTETGDYRFLAGNVKGDSMYMSCFDGSHAFMFTGSLSDQKINGTFFSGNHYSSSWKAVRNATYELSDPEKLTYIKEGESLSFEVKDTANQVYSYPNESLAEKVVIVQIMGTWCPNCLDESIYFKKLQRKFGEENLVILSVCYEVGDSFEDYLKAVRKMQTKIDSDFIYLIGGKAEKKESLADFRALNNFSSYPTSIIIDKKGNVVKIHTGFSGPATGEVYNLYTESMENLIKDLLSK